MRSGRWPRLPLVGGIDDGADEHQCGPDDAVHVLIVIPEADGRAQRCSGPRESVPTTIVAVVPVVGALFGTESGAASTARREVRLRECHLASDVDG